MSATTTANTMRRILVIGGNGFIGSAVCKAALARGIQVTSVSSSGRPYQTAKGHSPAWTSQVDWQQGDALNPSTFSHLFPQVDGVVHTLGLLLEDKGYKEAVRNGDIIKLIGSVWNVPFGGLEQNPLKRGLDASSATTSGSANSSTLNSEYPSSDSSVKMTYELMNRDSALRVCEAFISSDSASANTNVDTEIKKDAVNAEQSLGNVANKVPRPFVYISAEDIFRPVIPARYISTKREAEQGIERLISGNLRDRFRGVYIRPSLVYHAHHRPLSTPAAALLDLSATLHRKAPQGIPTPSSVLRSLSSLGIFGGAGVYAPPSKYSEEEHLGADASSAALSSPLESVANALTIPPIHVDTVASAICEALDSTRDIRGVVDVWKMRQLVGWKGASVADKQSRLEHNTSAHV